MDDNKYEKALEQAVSAALLMDAWALLEGRSLEGAPSCAEARATERLFLEATAAACAARRTASPERRLAADMVISLLRKAEGKSDGPWRAVSAYLFVTRVAQAVQQRDTSQ
jgi:hypothetical protein